MKLIFVLFFVAYVSWGYAGLFVFKTLKGKDKAIKYTVSLLIATFAAFSLYEISHTTANAAVSLITIALVSSALAIFWWAVKTNSVEQLEFAYTSTTEKQLIKTGPFAWVRHPFYLAYLMTWSGYTLYVQSKGSVMIMLTMFFLFIHAAIIEERELLESQDYGEYQDKVGMFLPRIKI